MVETVADLPERIKAVITRNHAFISASAGTGKTHTLTLRAIYLLLTVESESLYNPSASRKELLKAARDSVRSLVLTTFTKKASAEMQERVFKYLNRITGSAGLDELKIELQVSGDTLFLEVIENVLRHVPGEDFRLLQRGGQALVERAPELQISTLHSFANKLLASYPVESGIPLDAGFQSEDDPAGLDRESRLVDIWLQRKFQEGSRDFSDSLEKVLAGISLGTFKFILRESLLKEWLVDDLYEFTDTSRHGVTDPRLCLDTLRAWSNSVLKLKGNLRKAKGVADSLDRAISGVEENIRGSWAALAEIILQSKNYMFSGAEKSPKAVKLVNSELPDEYSGLLENYGELYRTALVKTLQIDSAESWEAFNFLLRTFVSWGRENLIRETGLVTFDDMISMAAGMLRDYPEVQAREYARLKSVLVDEFQDTDPVQMELLRNLITRPEGCGHEVLGFFVGDVKQSIYRFRDADVAGVEDFQENYRELARCEKNVDYIRLQTSFRSDPGIINYANHLFNGLLNLGRREENLLSSKSPEHGIPEWRLVDSGQEKENASARRDSVAMAVLAAVQEYIDEKGAEGNYPYEDILVLCRNYTELDPVINVLKRAGVPVISSGSKTFQMNTEVVDIANLLISLLDPLDSLSLASVLKSPVVGLSDAAIYRFFQESSPMRVFSGQKPVPEFISGREREQLVQIGRLARLRRGRGDDTESGSLRKNSTDEALDPVEADAGESEASTLSLEDWIAMVSSLIPADAYHRDYDLEGIGVSRIKKVLSDFKTVSMEASMPPLVWLLGEREKAIHKPMPDSGFSEDVSVADESVRAVRVMSIHKSKGLEGKYVILASWASLLGNGLGLSGRHRSKTVYDFPVQGQSRERAFRFKWGNLDLESWNYPEVEELDQALELQEVNRLAYVSATRPRERLLMLTPSSFVTDNKPEVMEILESYLEDAVSHNLLRQSTWQVGFMPENIAVLESPEEINAGAYWDIWSERLSRMELPKSKALKTEGSKSSGKDLKLKGGLPLFEEIDTIPSSGSSEIKMETGTLVHHYLELHLTDTEADQGELESLALIVGPAQHDPSVVDGAGVILDRFYSGETRDERGIPLRERIGNAGIIAREFPVMLSFQGESQSFQPGVLKKL